MKRFISEEFKKLFITNSHKFIIGLTIDGKYRWQQNERKGDISSALTVQELLFISELFKDIQGEILLILHFKTMW